MAVSGIGDGMAGSEGGNSRAARTFLFRDVSETDPAMSGHHTQSSINQKAA
jgi:hypothetical protein